MPYRCRFCDARLEHTFVDLGTSPVSNAYLSRRDLDGPETFFPLCVYVCSNCFLVQLPTYHSQEEIFSDDYAYYSSYSSSWLEHCREYVEEIVESEGYGHESFVVEIGSNDGYLLRYFLDHDVPVLGIEPCRDVAEAAHSAGIPSLIEFFGSELAKELAAQGRQADLLIGNNVLAHVPDLNGFVSGLKTLLKPDGLITMEFPHLLRLVADNEFDTIYHEHFSYFSLTTVAQLFAAHGLTVIDVREFETHGGSLRIYARHSERADLSESKRFHSLLAQEASVGVDSLEYYSSFGRKVAETKRALLAFLIEAKRDGKTVVGYGAPAKGNTLLNYCGIRTDFVDFTVDRNPRKQGCYLPGTRIPILAPESILELKPDYVLILAWNLREEIMLQMKSVFEWGGRFVVPIPELRAFDSLVSIVHEP